MWSVKQSVRIRARCVDAVERNAIPSYIGLLTKAASKHLATLQYEGTGDKRVDNCTASRQAAAGMIVLTLGLTFFCRAAAPVLAALLLPVQRPW